MTNASREAPLSPEELDRVLGSERDAEGMLLRGHLLLERELVRVLAARMKVLVKDLPQRMSFEVLARLALAGSKYDAVRVAVLAMNRVRNRLAHSLGYNSNQAWHDLADVVAQSKALAPDLFEGVTDATDEIRRVLAATLRSLVEVHIGLLTERRDTIDDLLKLREQLLLAADELGIQSGEHRPTSHDNS